VDYSGVKIAGFNNIELITDRPLDTNFKEIYAVKKQYPENTVIVSLMTESKKEWQDLIRRSEDAGADGLELNFGCPHGMCERGMGSSVGQEPKILKEITSWVKDYANIPVIIKLTPNVGNIIDPGIAAVQGGADALSLINTIKSIIGINLQNFAPYPSVHGESTNGGYCGPAVKPIALYMVGALAREKNITIPISGIGGISTWQDAVEFFTLGATTIQVCTAVMHYGYRIVEDMIDGLNNYLNDMKMNSINELIGKAIPNYVEWGDLDLNYSLMAKIDAEKCIGCQLCYIACLDGAHQCIHTRQGNCAAYHGKSDHGMKPRTEVMPTIEHKTSDEKLIQVPFIDEDECVGCNLCNLVCPVPGCITMEDVSINPEKESWNDRISQGVV
jgi:dihydropyrimidine dehydrogenase (NAD+) subunit PreA